MTIQSRGISVIMASHYSIDQKVSFIISLQVFLLGFKNCLIAGVPFLFAINDTLNRFITVFIGTLYIYSFWISRKKRMSTRCIAFWFFILLSYLFTILVFPQNIPYISSTLLKVMTILFMTSILLSKIRDLTWLDKYMTLFSYPVIIAGCISGLFISLIGHISTSEGNGSFEYAMGMSDVLLVSVIWLLHEFFKKSNYIALIFLIVGIIVIVLYGARNPLLAIVSYVIIEVIDNTEHNINKSKRTLYRFCLCMAALFSVFYKQVIGLLSDFLLSFGLNSRTLQMLAADEVDMSNRDLIHDQLWGFINANPITGLGIEGDLAQMGEMAHSLYLSILSTYGYIFGSLFIVYFAINCVSALRRAKGLDHQILVMYLCLVIPRGFTGGDMWGSDIFWWLMAFVFVIHSKIYKDRRELLVSNKIY